MYIFIDESGTTDRKNNQKFLVVAYAILENRAFADELISKVKKVCERNGRPITDREISYHALSGFQRELAIKELLASGYRNMYISFFDVESADKRFTTGGYEHKIQMVGISNFLSTLDKMELMKKENIRVIMDEKLVDDEISSVEKEFQRYLGTKKNISVEATKSTKERGIQLADLIAGGFRAKLMKKSYLFEIDISHTFQITTAALEDYV